MKRNSRLFLILAGGLSTLLLSFAAFPAMAQVFLAAEYFPLQSGNMWTYQLNGNPFDTATVRVLDGTVVVNGIATKAIEVSDLATENYTNDSNGLRLHRLFIPPLDFGDGVLRSITFTFSPPLRIAAAQSSIGQSIDGSGNATLVITGLGSFPLSYSSTSTLVAEENVSVPLGNFLAVKVRLTFTVTGSIQGQFFNETSSSDTWLARYVGEVKETSDSDVLELVGVWIDSDSDAVNVIDDNCPAVANGDQVNTDGDAEGDACDADDDNDGLSDDDEISMGRNPLLNEGAVLIPILDLLFPD